MACPFFFPLGRLQENEWAVPPRMPLGDTHTGECRACSEQFVPDAETLRHSCNVGYGRERCAFFPHASTADAVRFHVAFSSSETIELQFILERNYGPLAHGMLRYARAAQSFATVHGDSNVQQQAVVFIGNYLRRSA